MAAEFKSHVLRRDEKGLLLSGVLGGMIFALGGFWLGELSLPTAGGVALTTLIITGERYGMPLWLRLGLRLRGRWLIRAARHPQGRWARLAELADLPVQQLTRIDGTRLFAPPTSLMRGDLTEWVSLLDLQAADDELSLVDRPWTTTSTEAEDR